MLGSLLSGAPYPLTLGRAAKTANERRYILLPVGRVPICIICIDGTAEKV